VSSADLRIATADDAAQVAEIWIRSVQSAYRGFVRAEFLDSLEIARIAPARRRLFTSRPESRLFIATSRDSGDPLGYCEVGPTPPGTRYESELIGLYLVPEAHGTGLASALFHKGVAWLKEGGLRSMWLWVLTDNLRARQFYARHGGRLEGEKRVELAGREYPAVSFAWDAL